MLVAVFIGIFSLSVSDLSSYVSQESHQIKSIAIDPNIMNKDTLDYRVLTYAKTKSTKNEPFNVFSQEALIATMYLLLAVVVSVLFFHMGLVVCINMYFTMYKRDPTFVPIDYVICNPLTAGVLIILLIYVVIVDMIVYRKLFTETTRTRLLNVYAVRQNINSYIANNMLAASPKNAFLQAMKKKDYSGMVSAFNNAYGKKKEQMLFSLSLYTYFENNIPAANPEFDKIEKLICDESNNYKNPHDFAGYIYYQQVPSLENVLASFMDGTICNADAMGSETESNVTIDTSNTNNYNGAINDLNTKINLLKNLNAPRDALFDYIKWMFVTTLFFLIALCVFLCALIPELRVAIYTYVLVPMYNVAAMLFAKLQSLFGKK